MKRCSDTCNSPSSQTIQRLSCDLHDDLAPALAGIGLRLELLRAELEKHPRLGVLLDEILDETRRIRDEIHRAARGLRPADLEGDGLGRALRRLADRFHGRGTRIVVDVPTSHPGLSEATETAAYLIASEGLANALRHAGASQVTLRLRTTPSALELEVVDDGVGARPGGTPPGGLGLQSMARRADEVGGFCRLVGPESASGAHVLAVLPRRAS